MVLLRGATRCFKSEKECGQWRYARDCCHCQIKQQVMGSGSSLEVYHIPKKSPRSSCIEGGTDAFRGSGGAALKSM